MNRRTFALAAAALPLPFLSLRAQTPAQLQPLGTTQRGAAIVPSMTSMPQTNVIDAIGGITDFAEFVQLVQRGGRTDTLRGAGPFTLLAPTNAAIRRIPVHILNQLDANNITGSSSTGSSTPDIFRLGAFVDMHILPGRYTLADLQGARTIQTRNGNSIEINSNPGEEYRIRVIQDQGFGIGGINFEMRAANFTNPQLLCSNGVVLPINTPLIQ